MKRTPPWPLEQLSAVNRNSVLVYVAIRALAGDHNYLNTTRKRLSTLCGLRDLDTISAAVKVLGEAGWITVNYGRQGSRTWYRLRFPVTGFIPGPVHIGHREGRSDRRNRAQGSGPCTRSNPVHSRKGVGGGPALECGDPAPEPIHEHPSARIERESMAQIRAAREQRSAQSVASTEQDVEITQQNENNESQLLAKK